MHLIFASIEIPQALILVSSVPPSGVSDIPTDVSNSGPFR